MSAYTVETRASGCVVIAVDRPVTHLLALNLHRRGVEPLLLDPNSDASPSILTEYLLEHDLDYLIVFDSPAPALLSLITGQEYGTLLSINGALAEAARQVNLGEFISPGFCPTLDHFLSEALGEGTLTLSVGGITDYSLLSAESLVSCLVHCLFLPTFPTTPVLLANPAPISLLALANQLLPLLPHRAKLVFADGSPHELCQKFCTCSYNPSFTYPAQCQNCSHCSNCTCQTHWPLLLHCTCCFESSDRFPQISSFTSGICAGQSTQPSLPPQIFSPAF